MWNEANIVKNNYFTNCLCFKHIKSFMKKKPYIIKFVLYFLKPSNNFIKKLITKFIKVWFDIISLHLPLLIDAKNYEIKFE